MDANSPTDSNDLRQSGERSGKKRDPMIGANLDGRYLIEEVLGRGGMSVVYKATQLRVNRQVAIKTMQFQMEDNDVAQERFKREIDTLCTLNHPNIVTVYDWFIGPDDQIFVVMDYLRGRSLEDLIKAQGCLSIDQFARIGVQVCSALDHAHKKGIIHRDLKPANIMLMDEEMDFVKVVDFGLARLQHETRRLTRSGELWGSPPYVSPEQCMGEPGDERSDIYSLAAMMYEMLTGKDPFYEAGTIYDLLQRHVAMPPPPMAQTNPQVNIPAKLESVVLKGLGKTPRDRFSNVIDLQEALLHATAGSMHKKSLEHVMHLAKQARTRSSGDQSAKSGDNQVASAAQFDRALNPMRDSDLRMLEQNSNSSNQGTGAAGAPTSGNGNSAQLTWGIVAVAATLTVCACVAGWPHIAPLVPWLNQQQQQSSVSTTEPPATTSPTTTVTPAHTAPQNTTTPHPVSSPASSAATAKPATTATTPVAHSTPAVKHPAQVQKKPPRIAKPATRPQITEAPPAPKPKPVKTNSGGDQWAKLESRLHD